MLLLYSLYDDEDDDDDNSYAPSVNVGLSKKDVYRGHIQCVYLQLTLTWRKGVENSAFCRGGLQILQLIVGKRPEITA